MRMNKYSLQKFSSIYNKRMEEQILLIWVTLRNKYLIFNEREQVFIEKKTKHHEYKTK
jgi:hypothetical protein